MMDFKWHRKRFERVDYKNILVFNVNWLGDVLFSTPVFKALKVKYPKAKISCLAVPRVRPVLECCPYIDEIIVYDEKGCGRSLRGKLKLVIMLRKKRFDIAFLLHRSWTRALLMFFAGIPERVGYDAKGRGWLLTFKAGPFNPNAHRSDHYLSVIESFGVNIDDRQCELCVLPEGQKSVEALLTKTGIKGDQPFLIINPGGNWSLKRWPPLLWAQLVQALREKYGLSIIISGAAKDVGLAEEISRLSGGHAIVMAGRTNIHELVALMGKAVVVISADSGPMHIANCVGTDVVAIFGPTCPEITGPRGKGRVEILRKALSCNRDACYRVYCENNICMSSVSAEEVLEKVAFFLNEHN